MQDGDHERHGEPGGASNGEKLTAITVRLDSGRYERLKIAGVRKRLSNQAILISALDRWLTENG